MYNLTILRLKTRRSNEVGDCAALCASKHYIALFSLQAASAWLRHRNISTAMAGGVCMSAGSMRSVTRRARRQRVREYGCSTPRARTGAMACLKEGVSHVT
jgi:hypothetical protein